MAKLTSCPSWCDAIKGIQHHLERIPAKSAFLESNCEEEIKQILIISVLHDNCLISFKKSVSEELKERVRVHSLLKLAEETKELYVMLNI